MPILRPFRALRFDAATTDLASVLAPPYDIIGPAQRQALLEQDPHNAVRIELPADVGSPDPEAYRSAARSVAEWRTQGVLVKDRQPTITLHRMAWRDEDGRTRRCTGVLARLRLEPFGPGSGVLPHERTMSGPKEDRYRLLKATGLNTSPIVMIAGGSASEAGGSAAAASRSMARLTERAPDAQASTSDGVEHALWVVPTPDPGLSAVSAWATAGSSTVASSSPRSVSTPPDALAGSADGGPGPSAALAGSLLRLLGSAALTIADGHHRYETALRYRAERGERRACESDPPWDYALVLVYPLDEAPRALPTHRVIRGEPSGSDLLARLGAWFEVDRLADAASLLAAMSEPVPLGPDANGSGRLGLYTDELAAILTADRSAIERLTEPTLSEASRGLDVNILNTVLGPVFGDDPAALADDGRLRYVKDAAEAVRQVESREAATCFLLDPMPTAAISRVAEMGEVMPHKSTYFHPKAPAGLLFSPLEW